MTSTWIGARFSASVWVTPTPLAAHWSPDAVSLRVRVIVQSSSGLAPGVIVQVTSWVVTAPSVPDRM